MILQIRKPRKIILCLSERKISLQKLLQGRGLETDGAKILTWCLVHTLSKKIKFVIRCQFIYFFFSEKRQTQNFGQNLVDIILKITFVFTEWP